MTRLLAIETSSPLASLALHVDGALVREDSFDAGMTLCQALPRRIRALLGQERLADADLAALAVSLGPGSFTSLRVGMALAKAAAHALGIAIVGVPSAEVIAAGLEVGRRVAILQHARADEVYLTLIEGSRVVAPTVGTTLAEALRALSTWPAQVVCGDAIRRHREVVAEALPGVELAPDEAHFPSAAVLARLAEARLGDVDPLGAFSMTPLYVMASQAERAAAQAGAAAEERGQ